MYNLLIVDDERIIREGIFELLSMEEDLELNLFLAASAIDAQKILEERKVDIVLTDINMPKMSGIELFDSIQKSWPHCKVIFLTGYSDFDYVYKVQKQARYILKAEEDEKIVGAVSEAIEEIENDFMLEQISKDKTVLNDQQKVLDTNRFLYDLFNGIIEPSSITENLINRLDINLNLAQPIFYAVMRHELINRETYDEQIKVFGDMDLLIEKYFMDQMKGIYFHFTRNYIVLILQPDNRTSVAGNILAMKGKSELYQKACLKNFDLPVSVVVGPEPVMINEFLQNFQTIKTKLLISGDEALLITNEEKSSDSENNTIKSRLELVDYYFDNSNKEHVVALLNEAKGLFKGSDSMENLFGIEIYGDIAIRLIRFINMLNLTEDVHRKMDAFKLYNFSSHKTWEEAFNFLIDTSEILFEFKKASQAKCNDNVVTEVKNYIYNNLSGDTSLDRLSDQVGLCSEYLLRLFKKSEGVTILQYINDLKIIKAKKLIEDNTRQIKEIAFDLGFSSSGYFGRFFKSKTGLSPQGYRDNLEQR